VPYRVDHLSDDLFVAANFAIGFVSAAWRLSSDLHWNAVEADRPLHAALLADDAVTISRLHRKFQDAIGAVSHELTAVRNGTISVGRFTEPNAHEVAYRIGIDSLIRLKRCTGLEGWGNVDPARLTQNILDRWDACAKAMRLDVSNRLVEAEVVWEATHVELERAKQESSRSLSADQRTERKSESPETNPRVGPPKTILFGWADILNALGMPNDSTNKRRVKRLNDEGNPKGPISVECRGSRPKVERRALLEWWDRQAMAADNLQNQEMARQAVEQNTHNFERTGRVAPDVGGSIKTRKGRKAD
jgi:hypothetical protein